MRAGSSVQLGVCVAPQSSYLAGATHAICRYDLRCRRVFSVWPYGVQELVLDASDQRVTDNIYRQRETNVGRKRWPRPYEAVHPQFEPRARIHPFTIAGSSGGRCATTGSSDAVELRSSGGASGASAASFVVDWIASRRFFFS